MEYLFPLGPQHIDQKFHFSPALRPIEQRQYLVNGELKTWHGPTQEIVSPIYCGQRPVVLGTVPALDSATALEALAAATAAYDNGRGRWPTMTVGERISHLQKFITLFQQQRTPVVQLLMWEIGKNLTDSEKEFDRTIEYMVATIEALKDLDRASSRLVEEQGIWAQIRRAPLGVVLCMGPFNYPLNETFTTLIPALIMGNTVVFKPAKYGVLLHSPLLHAYQEAFPPGVINLVYGEGAQIIAPMMQSGKVDVLAFIGTSKVANKLRQMHPRPNRLRCVLGLEAKNAGIILASADLEIAVKECLLGSLSFNGQRCTALKILFVDQRRLPEFLNHLSRAINQLPAGMPWEKAAITPLPEKNKINYLQELLADATALGAKIINPGGGQVGHSLFFPALVAPVNSKMRLWHEEQFGPIVPVAAFQNIQEPIEYIQNGDYGQQVSLFGTDASEIAALIGPLVNQVCRTNINSQCQRGPDSFPFTGRKDSAEGTLSITDALRVFSIRTLVAAKCQEQNKKIIQHILYHHQSNFLSTDYLL